MAILIGDPSSVQPNVNQLPDPPLDPNDFAGWANWAQAINQRVLTLSGDSTPPDLVTNLALNSIYPGVLLTWTPVIKGSSYTIYRNTEPDFSMAQPLVQLFGRTQASWFDLTTDIEDGADVYYWIRASNDLGIQGPLSAMASGENSSPPTPPTPPVPGVITTTNLDVTLFANASPDDDLPSMLAFTASVSSSDMPTSATFWSGITEDEDFEVSTQFSSGGYSLP